MKPFEFVLVIISVIIGLSLTEFAIGISSIIQHHKTVVLYPPYIALVFTGFLAILNYWGTLYKLRNLGKWTITEVGIVFCTGLCFSVNTRIAFPEQDNFNQNYEQFFNDNIGVWYLVTIALLLIVVLETYLIKRNRSKKFYLIMGIYVLLILSCLVVDNAEYTGFVAIFNLFIQIYHMYSTRIIIEDI